MHSNRDQWSCEFGTLLASLFVGAASGGVAGFIVSSVMQGPIEDVGSRVPVAVTGTSPVSATSTAPTSTLSLIPLERRAAAPLVPPAFLRRRVSSVAGIYRRPRNGEDRSLGDDRLIGQAVAVTSDGWFVTAASVFDEVRSSEVVIWHEGSAYPIERGVRDDLSGAAFFKTGITGLAPTAFAAAHDLSSGAELWTETRPGEFAPAVALSVGARVSPNDSVSSETVSRRITVTGLAQAGDLGAAVWDPSGSLVGIMDMRIGQRPRLIPSSAVAASFSSLLEKGRVVHASLGVRAVDLAAQRGDVPRVGPASGALLREDRKAGRPAVQRDGPAAAALKAGDVILRIERDILDGTADLGELLAEYRPGSYVTLRVLRDGQDLDIPVQLGEVTTSEPLK